MLDHLIDRQLAVQRLPPGHRHGVVVENLVGNVDTGRDRGANGEQAGVKVSAVAEILKYVASIGERRLSEPGRAFAAHLREGLGAAIHPGGHVVTADTAVSNAAIGHDGRGIVRTAGTEPGLALGTVTLPRQRRFLVFQEFETFLD